MASQFGDVTLLTDTAPADWLLERIEAWNVREWLRVHSIIPRGYATYGRILHSAFVQQSGREERRFWRDIAADRHVAFETDITFQAITGWDQIAQGQQAPSPYTAPSDGSLSLEECSALVETLSEFTATAGECFFCLWNGYGTITATLEETIPKVPIEHRACFLFAGPIAAATSFGAGWLYQSPTIWWPSDRLWCVRTDVDGFSSYVGGTASCIQALAQHPNLEVVAAQLNDYVDTGL